MLASRLDGLPLTATMLIGVCAVAGNGWPVYMRFNGGRGVAVATGAVAALSVAGLIALLMCFAWGAIRGRIALAVLVGFVVLPAVAFFFGDSHGWVLGSGCLAILVLLLLRRLEGLPTMRGRTAISGGACISGSSLTSARGGRSWARAPTRARTRCGTDRRRYLQAASGRAPADQPHGSRR